MSNNNGDGEKEKIKKKGKRPERSLRERGTSARAWSATELG
jgi:hypothetical protein